MTLEQDKALPAAVVAALSRGRKLEAIKLLREDKRIGLKEAKDMVEDYAKSRPELSMRIERAQGEQKRTFLTWVVILAVLAFVVYWLLLRK